jgi:hypothetical protein
MLCCFNPPHTVHYLITQHRMVMTKLLLLLSAWLLALQVYPVAAQEQPATKEEIEEIRGVLEAQNESAAEYRGYVDALRKIKISGYLQTQFRLTDIHGAATPFSGGAFPTNSNKLFQVRRGRLKVTYDNSLTQFVVQLDAIQTGVTLKDAYITLTEPWLRSFGLQMGVFDRPFGYEVSLSSGVRESPERARMTQTLFPGERELGAKAFFAPQMGPLSFLRADLGVFNGSGPSANEYDSFKDVIARVGVQVPFEEANAAVDFGLSGYFGKVRNNSRFLWKSGAPAPGVNGMVVDSSLGNTGTGVTRRYLGVDAQLYYDMPLLGGLVLRGEVVTGIQPGTSDSTRGPSGEVRSTGKSLTTVSPTSQALGPVYRRKFLGWYLSAVQNIGAKDQVVIKYDEYDPNTDVAGADVVSGSNLGAADLRYRTLGLGVVHYWDENIKFLLYYEMVVNETVTSAAGSSLSALTDDLRDNVLTFRIQYRF